MTWFSHADVERYDGVESERWFRPSIAVTAARTTPRYCSATFTATTFQLSIGSTVLRVFA